MKKIISAGSVSANFHIHIRAGRDGQLVSAGLTNEFTHHIPLYTQNALLAIQGTFGSGSASTTIAIDRGISAAGPFLNILSISAPQATSIPVYADEIIRIRHTFSSAAVGVTNGSVNVWIG